MKLNIFKIKDATSFIKEIQTIVVQCFKLHFSRFIDLQVVLRFIMSLKIKTLHRV